MDPTEQEAPPLPTINQVVEALHQASTGLATIAQAQQNGVNIEEMARQVDAEYARVADHLGNLAYHLLDLATNPRPKPEDYSAKI